MQLLTEVQKYIVHINVQKWCDMARAVLKSNTNAGLRDRLIDWLVDANEILPSADHCHHQSNWYESTQTSWSHVSYRISPEHRTLQRSKPRGSVSLIYHIHKRPKNPVRCMPSYSCLTLTVYLYKLAVICHRSLNVILFSNISATSYVFFFYFRSTVSQPRLCRWIDVWYLESEPYLKLPKFIQFFKSAWE